MGVDLSKFFLPLDEEAIAFPGASAEQRLALSQLMGIIVNTTVAEMEDVAHKIRDVAWRKVLDAYPVNPEMYALGDQFFLEEAKHATLFRRFNELFCEEVQIDPAELNLILPNAYGAVFQKAIIANAKLGGFAFWWVVAVVEEVALLIYQNLYKFRKDVDPLFYHIHRKHFEEESRHTNYAFMMLELIKTTPKAPHQRLLQKLDLAYSELFSSAWILSELYKFKRVKDLAHKHPFFEVLSSCIPLMGKLSKAELAKRMFVSAPYISLILNRNYHKYSVQSAKDLGAFCITHPKPHSGETTLGIANKQLLDQANDAWLLNS